LQEDSNDESQIECHRLLNTIGNERINLKQAAIRLNAQGTVQYRGKHEIILIISQARKPVSSP
jgi:hypothetical protein